ncbi:MAG: hypothetical protein R2864_06040 [Syntrophotaleaceae bacterium]
MLVGGLGMAITPAVRTPATAEVVVAELNPKIHEWCLDLLADFRT